MPGPAGRRPRPDRRGADRLQEADPVLHRRRRRGQRHRGAAGDRLRRQQLRARRPRRGDPARRRAARRLRDRRPQDVRPHVGRHDLLRPRAGPRRRPRRHHRAAAGHHRPRPATTPGRSSGSTTSWSRSRSPPTGGTPCRCAASPASWRHAFGVPFRDPALVPAPGATDEPAYPVDVRDPSAATGSPAASSRGVDPAAPTPGVHGPAAHPGRHPHHLAAGRHHQLPDARAGPADARVRPRPAAAARWWSAGRRRGRS